MYFVSGSYLLNPLKEFYETFVKCSVHEDDAQNPCFNLAGSRSRSAVVFEDLNHVFEPLEGIS
jgi:hypothetical protein